MTKKKSKNHRQSTMQAGYNNKKIMINRAALKRLDTNNNVAGECSLSTRNNGINLLESPGTNKPLE